MKQKKSASREEVMREEKARVAFENARHCFDTTENNCLDIERAESHTYKNNPYKSLETMQGFSLFAEGVAFQRNIHANKSKLYQFMADLFKKKFRVVPCGNGQYKIQEQFLLMWLEEDYHFFNGKTYASKYSAEKAIEILEKL